MKIVIRKARIDDLETLFDIELKCFGKDAFSRSQLAHFLDALRYVSLIAEVDGEQAGFIIGSVEYCDHSLCGHIFSLDVSPTYRRKSAASKLLAEAERSFKAMGAETCYLEVRTSNVAARRLYKKFGYVTADTLKAYYGTGTNGLKLKKDL